MNEVKVCVEVEVNPTESEEKVKESVENVLGFVPTKIKLLQKSSILSAEVTGIESLDKFYDLLRRERILAAARKVFFSSLNEQTITFYLNKQVAFSSHISFADEFSESPLGSIKVKLYSSQPESLINWLAPRTER